MSAPPPCHLHQTTNNWTPFDNHKQFEITDLLFCCVEMSAPNINALFDIWGLLDYEPESVGGDDVLCSEDEAANPHPFQSYSEMYDCIDESMLGDLPWKCYACMLFHQKVLIHRQLHQLICK